MLMFLIKAYDNIDSKGAGLPDGSGDGGGHGGVPPVRDRAQGGNHIYQGEYASVVCERGRERECV